MAGDAPDSGYPSQPPAHWPARLAPPPDATPPEPKRAGMAGIIAAAVVFTLIVTYGLGQALVRANDPGSRTRTPDTLPTTTTTPVEGQVPLAQAVPALISFVEEQRGARFDPVPQVTGQPDSSFESTVATYVDQDLALARHRITYRALGIVPVNPDLMAELRLLRSRSAMAAADPRANSVIVRGQVTTPFIRSTIVAELTRLLDRQLPPAAAPDPSQFDASFAAEALASGSAGTTAAAYVAQLNQADQQSFQQDRQRVEALRGLSGAGDISRFIDVLPGVAGQDLVGSILQGGGHPALDRAFKAPPRTSEQAFDPAAYERNEPALGVDGLAAPDGQVIDAGRFGLVDVAMLLPPVDAFRRIQWGGGRFQTWQTADQQLCVRVRVAGDTAAATTAMLSELQAWATRVGLDATAELVPDTTLGRPVIQLHRCTFGP